MNKFIEQCSVYGPGKAQVTASINQGTLHLRQDALEQDFHMDIQISSREGIERLEALLSEIKQQYNRSVCCAIN